MHVHTILSFEGLLDFLDRYHLNVIDAMNKRILVALVFTLVNPLVESVDLVLLLQLGISQVHPNCLVNSLIYKLLLGQKLLNSELDNIIVIIVALLEEILLGLLGKELSKLINVEIDHF